MGLIANFFTELASSVITAYGVYAITISLLGRFFHRKPRWQEEVESIGGLLWILGVFNWRLTFGEPDVYDLDTFLRYLGAALLILSRLVSTAQRAFQNGE